MTSSGPLDPMVQDLEWIMGKWSSEDGQRVYPTNEDFRFGEEVEFTHYGQPHIQFNFSSWHPETYTPLQREVGFLRMKHNSKKVAMISSQSSGSCEIVEGEVNGQEMTLESCSLANMSFAIRPLNASKVKRVFRLQGEILEQIIYMETSTTPLTEHSRIRYMKKE